MKGRYLRRLIIIPAVILALTSFAQIPKGTWRDHLPYSNGKVVAIANNKIWCATNFALYNYDLSDQSINKFSKINGLSDLEIGYIAFSDKHNKLIVGYINGNIDILENGNKTNIPDIKTKNVIANKTINHICIYDNFAYLSTGFGIVAFNLEKNEIADTYIIGDNGAFKGVNNSIVFNNFLYALCDDGIYMGDLSSPFLANFENWHKVENLPFSNNKYYESAIFNNKLFVANSFTENDTSHITMFDGAVWDTVITNIKQLKSLGASENSLLVIKQYHIREFNENLEEIFIFSAHNGQHVLKSTENIYWVADSENGLLSFNENKESQKYCPNGPKTGSVFEFFYNNGEILVAPGGYIITGQNLFNKADVYKFSNETWTSLSDFSDPLIEPLRDMVTFTSNQKEGEYYVGTWGYGIIQVKNNSIINIYNSENTDTVLENFIGGMKMDNNGNLWALCRNSNYPFVVKTPQNNWYKYDYSSEWNKNQTYKVIQTQNGNFWTISQRGDGIYVWNYNNTPETDSDDTYKKFALKDETGSTINTGLNDIAEDIEGTIWIATNNGVAVYDYPNRALDETIYARVPQLVIEGYLKDLLEGESVSCIAVDGANRKWFGTTGGGLFLVSSDGTEQIINWNTSNSKLFSNTIYDIEINHKTGELFIGTDKGIQSFMGTSTENKSNFSDIYAFPNPVRKDYNGYITIRGLMYQTNVKVTDLSGRLVFETLSNGGDAIWNGKDMGGEPVASGVYLVMCTNQDGSESEVTKILIVK